MSRRDRASEPIRPPAQWRSRFLPQPCACGGDHRFNPRLKGRMNHWSEFRAMIDRQIVELPFRFSLGVNFGVASADKPVDRRRVPLRPEATEVLAGRSRPGVMDAVSTKMVEKRRRNAVARRFVIDVEGITIEGRDFGRAWRAGGLCFRVDDPLDCRQYALAYPLIKCSHVQLYQSFVWDHVFLCASLEHPDGHHGGLSSANLARHNGL